MIATLIRGALRLPFGRQIAPWVIGALVVAYGLLKAFNRGKRAEQTKQKQASLKALQTKVKVDETVRNMSSAELDALLSRWVSGDE